MLEQFDLLNVHRCPLDVGEIVDPPQIMDALISFVVVTPVVLDGDLKLRPREIRDQASPTRMKQRHVEHGFREARLLQPEPQDRFGTRPCTDP